MKVEIGERLDSGLIQVVYGEERRTTFLRPDDPEYAAAERAKNETKRDFAVPVEGEEPTVDDAGNVAPTIEIADVRLLRIVEREAEERG